MNIMCYQLQITPSCQSFLVTLWEEISLQTKMSLSCVSLSCWEILYIRMPEGPGQLVLMKGMFHFASAITNVNRLTIMSSKKNLGKHHYQTVQKQC